MYAIADVSFYLPLAETVVPKWHAIHSRFLARRKNLTSGDADEAKLLREGLAERIWLKVGDPSYLAYIERTLGYVGKTARERLRVAIALGDLPHMEDALRKGERVWSSVRELTRVGVAATEMRWLEEAKGKNPCEVQRMVSGRAEGDLPEAPSRPENIRHALGFSDLSAQTFARFRQARQALENELGHALTDDAFLSALADLAIAPGETTTSRRAPNQIAVTVCTCGRGWQDGAGRPIEIEQTDIELAKCDAERIGSVDDPRPKRASQDISPATRRMMLRRDENRCRVEGCRSSRNLHGHHIDRRKDDGTGELENLVTVCGAHHRAIHEGLVREIVTEDGELRLEHVNAAPSSDVIETSTRALVGLGFSTKEAKSFVAEAMAHVGHPTVEALVTEALRRSPSR
jgi:hypothetical protein